MLFTPWPFPADVSLGVSQGVSCVCCVWEAVLGQRAQGGFPAWLGGHSSAFVPKCVPCSGHRAILRLFWKMHLLCIYEICFSLLMLEIFLCFLRSGEDGLVFPQQVLPVLCPGCCGLQLAVTSSTAVSSLGLEPHR